MNPPSLSTPVGIDVQISFPPWAAWQGPNGWQVDSSAWQPYAINIPEQWGEGWETERVREVERERMRANTVVNTELVKKGDKWSCSHCLFTISKQTHFTPLVGWNGLKHLNLCKSFSRAMIPICLNDIFASVCMKWSWMGESSAALAGALITYWQMDSGHKRKFTRKFYSSALVLP